MFNKWIKISLPTKQFSRGKMEISCENDEVLRISRNLWAIKISNDNMEICKANYFTGIKEKDNKISGYPNLYYSIGTGISGGIKTNFGAWKIKQLTGKKKQYNVLSGTDVVAEFNIQPNDISVTLDFNAIEYRGILCILGIELLKIVDKGFDD
jgi:hypothetical protein